MDILEVDYNMLVCLSKKGASNLKNIYYVNGIDMATQKVMLCSCDDSSDLKFVDVEELAPWKAPKLTSDQNWAVLLHHKYCNHNHTDDCDWHYHVKKGVHDWNTSAHKLWLQKVERIKKNVIAGSADNFFTNLITMDTTL